MDAKETKEIFCVRTLADDSRKRKMKIRNMQPQDVEDVVRLYQMVFAESPWNETWSHEAALAEVYNPIVSWWVAREGIHLAGFVAGAAISAEAIATRFKIPVQILQGDKIGYLSDLGTHPQFRERGVARAMTNELLNYFRKEKIDQFVVRTRPGTGNFPWYDSKLDRLHTYEDGRVLFGCRGIPNL